MEGILQSVCSGFLMGGVYGSVAAGLAIIYGVMRIINFAHGELVTIGMFVAFWCSSLLGFDPYISMLPAGIILFGFGYLIQKALINPALKRTTEREPLTLLLITAGISMILINVGVLIWSDYPKMIRTSYSLSSIGIGTLRFPVTRIIAFGVSMVLIGGLYLTLLRTEVGRRMRAASQDREAAKLMGINEEHVYCLAFGVGAAIAGMAGVLLSTIFFIKPSAGEIFVMRSFIIVVLGGMGSIPGALVGGIIVGLIESVGSQFMNPVYAEMLVFILFIFTLLIRPSGLLGREEV